ncbi:MAG: protein-L-isoaspartate O-methyltransferase [Ignavibacteriae bacterium HGW-Ignavibacteriae-1]|jgi:protein-L-isoaspartate(D-aspartate) O-methyltransferase|nr:MAG: protein-L-isoaspartate O-methyltransferase [Ignavibacteriae bacterium HGW-Ignavibacteriae-1]
MLNDFLRLNPEAREKLVKDLEKKGIFDKNVLNALLQVPRELFLDPSLFVRAYDDMALPIEFNQTISQPYTVAFMTQLLELKQGDRVLEIGTGSGYQSMILKLCSAEVFTIERISQLYHKSKSLFEMLNFNIHIELGDGSVGLPEFMPYDAIIVTAGLPSIPNELVKQLKFNGKIVAPVGDLKSQTMTKLIRIDDDKFTITEHSKFRFVPLIGDKGWYIDDQN